MFHEYIVRPFFNLLIYLYNVIPGSDFGLAIIVLTVLIRLVFSPLSIKTQRAQRSLNALNPKIQEIREKHKNDQVAQSNAIMQLYREHKINPFAGCLPLLIQIPILLALYKAFLEGFNPDSLSMLYSFIEHPGTIERVSFGFLDVTTKNSFLAVIAGVLQFIQAKVAFSGQTPGNPTAAAMNTQMLYIFPVMVVFITWTLPAGLGLYWATSTLFSIGEQFIARRST